MAELKTTPTAASAASFVAAIEDDQKRADSAVLLELLGEITGQAPVMWGPSIVGFGRHHYRYETGREGDTFTIGFSPRKQSLTVYVGGLEFAEGWLAELGPHSLGKGCLYIKRLSDVDRGVLRRILAAAAKRPGR